MTISIEKMSGEPIVLVKFSNPFIVDQDVPAFIQNLGRVFDDSQEQIFDITDASGLKTSFAEMVKALAAMTREGNKVLSHPRVIGYAIVVDSGLLQIGAQALGQVQYGALPATVVKSLDEALVVAREAIAKYRTAHS
jgi:hypothetical protein